MSTPTTEPFRTERAFDRTLRIEAPPDLVWQALSRDTELQRWFCPEARIDPRPGGELVWRWGDHHEWVHRIEVLEPGKLLRTRYDSSVPAEGGGLRPLFVEFRLEGSGGATTLRVTHSGFGPEAAFDDEYQGISRGWPVELRSLQLYLERHPGQERRIAWSVGFGDGSPAEVWERLTGAEGLGCGPDVASQPAGAPFRAHLGEETFEGEVLLGAPYDLTGLARSHGDAFLRCRVGVAPGSGPRSIWVWLATWGRPAEETARVQAGWNALLRRLYPEHADRLQVEGRQA